MSIDERLLRILEQALEKQVSDVHLAPGQPVFYRVQGLLSPELGGPISATDSHAMAQSILTTPQLEQLQSRGSVDGAISLDAQTRFRYNIYRRDNQTCFAFRLLPTEVASLGELGLSDRLYDLSELKDGLVLVAGPTGSGKSTTIAALVSRINQSRCCHIITIEDPVEFIHRSRKSLVNQRQVGVDVGTFNQALLDAVRQDPDVILVGELRDEDTIRTAITAAETGHLVFASIHAGDCKTAIERLAGAYSAGEQNLAQRLIATVVRAIVVQHLLPRHQNPNALRRVLNPLNAYSPAR